MLRGRFLVESSDCEDFEKERQDLKWCGSSVLYTFMKAVPDSRGELLDYGQWNIDEESAVTYGALAFTKAARRSPEDGS